MLITSENILSEPNCKPYFEDVLVISANQEITQKFLVSINDFFLVMCGTSLMMNNNYHITINNQSNIQKTTFASEVIGFTDITTSIKIENKSSLRYFLFKYTTQSELIHFNFCKNKIEELSGYIARITFFLLVFNQVIYNYLEMGVLDLDISNSSVLKH